MAAPADSLEPHDTHEHHQAKPFQKSGDSKWGWRYKVVGSIYHLCTYLLLTNPIIYLLIYYQLPIIYLPISQLSIYPFINLSSIICLSSINLSPIICLSSIYHLSVYHPSMSIICLLSSIIVYQFITYHLSSTYHPSIICLSSIYHPSIICHPSIIYLSSISLSV